MSSISGDLPQNGATGRDPRTGKFLPDNPFGRRRRRAVIETPPIPGFIADHPGVRTLWPVLAGLASQGHVQALALLADLCLGKVTPQRLSGRRSPY